MLADLENALEVEVARAGRSTGEATTVLDSVPRRRRLVPSRRVSIAGVLLVLAATAAALLIAGLSGKDHTQRDRRWRRRRGTPSGDGGRAHQRPGLRPRGRRRRAPRRGQARDRRDPEHHLADRDLHRRPRPLALGQVRRRADRRGGGPGRRPEPDRRHHARAAGAPTSTPPTAARRPSSPAGATRSARSAAPNAQQLIDLDVPVAGQVLPDLVHEAGGGRRRRPGGGQRRDALRRPIGSSKRSSKTGTARPMS